MVIGGGYATGRELAEFFLVAGPRGGLLAIRFATILFSLLCALTFVLARRLPDLRLSQLLQAFAGPGWPLFELTYILFVVLILAVYGAAAGAIGRPCSARPSGSAPSR